ncbi:hypothetical protein BaRGS_00004667 [Batillaria attramentaria]|uniref:Uncharacterized protein n=1 Tax=Batillaria attramentaria TaxID=370345 RepID=A0ABD0LWP8_9CAEN
MTGELDCITQCVQKETQGPIRTAGSQKYIDILALRADLKVVNLRLRLTQEQAVVPNHKKDIAAVCLLF